MKNYGFKPDIIKPEDYVFGASPVATPPLLTSGQWDAYLPLFERQNANGVETYNCTGFGTLNCIETLLKLVEAGKLEQNYADRAVGIAAGTREGGNSPHVVAETIRKVPCMVPEFRLPFDATIQSIDEYYTPDPLTENLVAIGNGWLANYDFKHEWVFIPNDLTNETIAKKQELIIAALQHSPIGVSVHAWPEPDAQGVYHKTGDDNHWVMLYGYAEGEYWKIFDNYDGQLKKLAWDYDFGFAKRYAIQKKEVQAVRQSWLARLVAALLALFTKH